MWSYIFAGLILFITLLIMIVLTYANGVYAVKRDNTSTWTVLFWGLFLAGMVLASHWLPRLGW